MFDKQVIQIFDFFHSIGLAFASLSANVIDYTLSIITAFVTGPLNSKTGMLAETSLMSMMKGWISISVTLLMLLLVCYVLYLVVTGKGPEMISAVRRTALSFMTLQVYVLIVIMIMGLASLLVGSLSSEKSTGEKIFATYVSYNPEIVEIFGSEKNVSNAILASGATDIVSEFDSGTFNDKHSDVVEPSALRYDVDSGKFYNLSSSDETLNGEGMFNDDVEPEMIYVFKFNVLLQIFAFIITLIGFIFIGILKGKEVMGLAFSFLVGPITLATAVIDKGASFSKWFFTTIKMAINIWIAFLAISIGIEVFALMIDGLKDSQDVFGVALGTIMLMGSLILHILDGPKILNDVWQMDSGLSTGGMAAVTNRGLATGGNKLSSLGNKVSNTTKSGVKSAASNEKSYASMLKNADGRGSKAGKNKSNQSDNTTSGKEKIKNNTSKTSQVDNSKIPETSKNSETPGAIKKGNQDSQNKNTTQKSKLKPTVEKPFMENGYPYPADDKVDNGILNDDKPSSISKILEKGNIKKNIKPINENKDLEIKDKSPNKQSENIDSKQKPTFEKPLMENGFSHPEEQNSGPTARGNKANSNRGKRTQTPAQKQASKDYLLKKGGTKKAKK